MPAQIIELYKSREGVESVDNPSAVLLYVVTGANDDVEVRTTVEAHVAASYAGLPIQDYDFRPLGNGIWEVAAHYGVKKQTNQSSFSFDTGGGTAHITNSIATVGWYPANAPNCQGAIGISGDSVEGVDITVPVYNFSETHYLPAAFIDGAYKATLFALASLAGTQGVVRWAPHVATACVPSLPLRPPIRNPAGRDGDGRGAEEGTRGCRGLLTRAVTHERWSALRCRAWAA